LDISRYLSDAVISGKIQLILPESRQQEERRSLSAEASDNQSYGLLRMFYLWQFAKQSWMFVSGQA